MDESNVFVSATQKWHPSKRLMLVVGVGVVLITGGSTAYFFVHRERQTDQLNAAYKLADMELNEGKFSQAISTLQKVQGDTHTNLQKGELYGLMARSAATIGNVRQAGQYYALEHKYEPSTIGPDAYALANTYQLAGQKQQAVEQYKLSIQYLENRRDSQHNPKMTAYLNAEIGSEQSLLEQEESQ